MLRAVLARGRRPVRDRTRGSREAWYYTRRLTALKSGAARRLTALPNHRLSKQKGLFERRSQ
jgi:hypothetical protein